ncbi:MAG: NB-ARC domain-containing protein, partial [Cyanobacteria bacterium P01_G01_bin.67]
RSQELNSLKQSILETKCRLVGIFGIGGVGKSSLAIHLAQEIETEFDFIFWRSLRNAPAVESMLIDIIKLVSGQQITELNLSQDLKEIVEQLLNYLRQYRCLLVLDNLETILQTNAVNYELKESDYIQEHQGYGQLIEIFADTHHQSCLLLTGREVPSNFIDRTRNNSLVYSLQLSGLDISEAKKIIHDRGLIKESDRQQEKLINYYAGNPLALKIITTSIKDLFCGNLTEFWQAAVGVFGDINDLLNQQWQRLSRLEQDVLYWLAREREAISLNNLESHILSISSIAQLLTLLQSLKRRSFIERTSTGFTLQPVVMEFVTEKFIENIYQDIITQDLNLLISHSLINVQTKEYIRTTQTKLIIKPLINRLFQRFVTKEKIQSQFNNILNLLHDLDSTSGYGAGNLINLLNYLDTDLTGYDFSGLNIWQADLRGVNLHQVNFSSTDLSNSMFSETIGTIFAVDFSPDGRFLATADTKCEIQIWQIPELIQIKTLFRHEASPIWSVAFSEDGNFLASGSNDKLVKLWNFQTGACIQTLKGHAGNVFAVAWSPETYFNLVGINLVASGSEDNTVKLWNVATGECIATLENNYTQIRSLSFHPNGFLLAVGVDNGMVDIWNLTTQTVTQSLPQQGSQYIPIVFNPRNGLLAVGYQDGSIKLWDCQKQIFVKTLHCDRSQVFSLCFSDDGQTLINSYLNLGIRIWHLETGQCVYFLGGHTSRISSIALTPNGKYLASASEDGTVRLWDADQGQFLKLIKGQNARMWSFVFIPDGNQLVSGSEDSIVRYWQIDSGRCHRTLTDFCDRVKSLFLSPDGKLLAIATYSYQIAIVNFATGKLIKTLPASDTWCWSVNFSPDSQFLAVCGGHNYVNIWHVESGQLIKQLQGHQAVTLETAFIDNQTLVSSSGDGTIKIWNLATEECIRTISADGGWIWSVDASPINNLLVTGNNANRVQLWDLETGTNRHTLVGHHQYIMSVCFSPDGKLIASASTDCTIRVWDTATGDCLHVMEDYTDAVMTVIFSPDSQIVAGGGHDETIKLWSVTTGKHLKTFRPTRLYEGLNIAGATGLNSTQTATVKALGAVG